MSSGLSGWVELEEERNTSVYVSNLPLNITEESFVVSFKITLACLLFHNHFFR